MPSDVDMETHTAFLTLTPTLTSTFWPQGLSRTLDYGVDG